MKKTMLYGAIQKVQEQDDGTLIVEGVASSETEDAEGEVIKADAMRAAIPDYMKFGAVREMHQPIAAGTAINIEVNDAGQTVLRAHVIDESSIKKVKAGVLKGFSIGGRVTGRDQTNKAVITGLNLVEVSLVDRPCNPDAVITCYKADGVDEADDEQPAQASEETPPAEDETVQKSLGVVSDFAMCLQHIGYLISDLNWEADYEGDESPIPAQMLEWLRQGVGLWSALAAEESAELLAIMEQRTKAQAAEDLAKAGQRFSKATKSALAEVHKMLGECSDRMAALGYADAEEAEEEADKADQVELQKAHGDLTLTKAALAKAHAERDKLAQRVAELEALPEAPKGAVADISKAADMGQQQSELQPVRNDRGEVDDAATLIKAAHTRPIRLF